MVEDKTAVVIDCGSGMVKAGFGGDDAPRSVFQTIVGRHPAHGTNVGLVQKEVYVGSEALHLKCVLNMSHPI
jgi:actin-related protein